MLKWQGDFTLSRFRAKLADKYLLHPDVEPGYNEHYRQDLGSSLIMSEKLQVPIDGFDTIRRDGSTGRLADIVDDYPRTAPRRRAGSISGSRGFGNYSSTLSLNGSQSLTRSQSGLGFATSNSSPSLGVRRAEGALRQGAGLGGSFSNTSLGASGMIATAPSSPSGGDADAKKEMEAQMFSRRLWMASQGAGGAIKEHLTQLQADEPDPKNWVKMMKDASAVGMTKALKSGARIDWRNPEWNGATLFLKSVRTGDISMMMYLLAQGADATVCDDSGRNCLHWAAMEGSTKMMENLLFYAGELDVNQVDSGGDTALHIAAYQGKMSSMRLLIAVKADPGEFSGNQFNATELAEARRMWHISHYLGDNKQQEDDKANETATIKDFDRPCNHFRARELKDLEIIFPKPKPKAKAKAKSKK